MRALLVRKILLARHYLLLLRVLVVNIHELCVRAFFQMGDAWGYLWTLHSRLVVDVSEQVLDFKRLCLAHCDCI